MNFLTINETWELLSAEQRHEVAEFRRFAASFSGSYMEICAEVQEGFDVVVYVTEKYPSGEVAHQWRIERDGSAVLL